MNSVVVGIDPSLNGTGLAVLQGGRLTYQHVRLNNRSDNRATGTARLLYVAASIDEFLTLHKADTVCMEGVAMHGVGRVADIAELHGAVRVVAALQGCSIVTVPPSALKKYATGNGRADKQDMIAAARRRTTGAHIPNDDIADAVLLMFFGIDLRYNRDAKIRLAMARKARVEPFAKVAGTIQQLYAVCRR
jgi:Holliday junction resolvasome RuvABC endonuclease subunit